MKTEETLPRFTAIAAVVTLALTACGDGETEQAGDSDVATDSGTSEPIPDPGTTDDAGPPPGPEGDDGVLGSDEVSQGQWFAKTERRIPQALFGAPQTEANFLVRCEGEELVFIRSAPIEGEEADMTLMAGGQTRTITARERPGPLAQTAGSLRADDPFASVLAETTEPIAVALEDGPSYRMPASAALRDVVSNCG